MMKTLTITVAATLAFATLPAQAANPEAGKTKVQEICQACHGMDGLSAVSPEYPRLAGQHRDYLAKALRDYKSGARKNAVMNGMVATLTAADLENVAAYYSAQPTALYTRY